MSFPNREAFERHRAAGRMPRGGPYPEFDSLPAEPRELLFASERVLQLERLLEIMKEHPADLRLLARISRLVGRQVAPAEVHYDSGRAKLLSEASRDGEGPQSF